MSPSEVMRAALDRLEARRYAEVAAFVDRDELRSMVTQLRRNARIERKELTLEEYRRNNPNMPEEVAAWHLRQMREFARPEDPLRELFARVANVEELDRLDDDEAFGRMLEAQEDDYRRQLYVEAEGERVPREVAAEIPQWTEPHPRRVLGHVIDGDRAYVLHDWSADPNGPHRGGLQTAYLRRDGAGDWKLSPTAFLRSSALFAMDFEAARKPDRERPPSGPIPRQRAWIERTFPSELEPDRFPAILERFRSTPTRVYALVPALDQEALRWHPEPATPDGPRPWSIQQHIGHLADLEALGELRLRAYLDGATELPAADMTNRRTDEADHESRNTYELVDDFQRSRYRLCAVLERMGTDDLRRTAHHPRLDQPMTVVDWVYFMCEHDDHHLARITELKRAWRARGPSAAET